MTEYIVSIDPGVSTGIALLSYGNDTPPVLEEAWQFRGGVKGLLEWISNHTYEYTEGAEVFRPRGDLELGETSFGHWTDSVTVVAEKFTARNTRGFSYTTVSLEPLRCEGALIALGLMPDYSAAEKRWVDPGHQYIAGGKDKADKKKRQHRFLKDSGFYRTGKDLDAPDADDLRSACAHALGYLSRSGHKPSYELIAGWE